MAGAAKRWGAVRTVRLGLLFGRGEYYHRSFAENDILLVTLNESRSIMNKLASMVVCAVVVFAFGGVVFGEERVATIII